MATTKKQRTPRKFTLNKVVRKLPVGQVVYECIKTDYGAAVQDEEYFKEKYNLDNYKVISVTLREDGDWPCFTVPMNTLKEVKTQTETEKNGGK